ncbi:MAG: helix-turn-helix domain-containing protein [Candidatus Izemoplasmatales bacterium]
MIKHLKSDLVRRREIILKHYYTEIGSLIRKKRIEKKLTQEELSRGIVSHTYLSKIEHNAISINKDSLFMIMERIDISSDVYSLPEEMLDILEESLVHFFRLDFSGFQILYEDSLKYEYGILIEIARFGYFVMVGDTIKAGIAYNELHRYLCSIEDYGFTIYAIYAIYYNLLIHDYTTARNIYEQSIEYHSMNEMIFGLFEYAKFVIYGKLHLFNISRDGYDNAKNIFIASGATKRVEEMSVYMNLFRYYEGREQMHIPNSISTFVSHNDFVEYLLFLMKNTKRPEQYLKHIDEMHSYYPLLLYTIMKVYDKKENQVKKEQYEKLLQTYYQNVGEYSINFYELHQVRKKSEWLYKDYLIEYCLPFAESQQNLYFMRKITDEIVSVLSSHKRYKDAISYEHKYQKVKSKMNGTISSLSKTEHII